MRHFPVFVGWERHGFRSIQGVFPELRLWGNNEEKAWSPPTQVISINSYVTHTMNRRLLCVKLCARNGE